MKTFLTIAAFLIVFISNSQGGSVYDKKPDSLYYTKPFFALYPSIRSGNTKLKDKEAVALFVNVPEASVFYKKYRNKKKAGIYSFAGFFLFTAVSSVSFDKGNRGLAATGLTLSFSSFINSVIFFSWGEANLKKAIGSYNRFSLR